MPTTIAWPLVATVVPSIALLVAAATIGRTTPAATAWRAARAATVVAAVAAVVAIVARVLEGADADGLVRLDSVTVVMLALIALVGWVVVRFSATYLAGDAHEQRYARRMLATLAAVSLVVVANHLVLLVLAWGAASVALHGLLTHFGDRPVAVAVAHKKFLLARCADACMVGAVVAFGLTFDTLRIDGIVAAAVEASSLPAGARIGILLVAMAALLKCAQLPFHGWLIQVMEAPTPVSALLHAGVVNLGGFVLLRFAPVVDRAVETRTLLVVVGVATAVIASLVMTTRVSVKVALAWSTCAQMGFMLMQCGLGLWEMALLHLLAHSLYKAHAFLSAGGTVRQTQRRQLVARSAAPAPRALAAATLVALAGTAVVAVAWQALPGTDSISASVWVMLGVVALAVVPFTLVDGRRPSAGSMVAVLAVPLAYLALHEVFAELVPHGASAPAGLLVFTGVAFLALFAVQATCRVHPDAGLVRRLRPWIYAGLFLDDAFTRIAFTVSPPPSPQDRPAPLPKVRSVAVVRTPSGASARVMAASSPFAGSTSSPTSSPTSGSDAS